MSNTIPVALGVYEGQDQVESKMIIDNEQNTDKKTSHSENNSQKINNSDDVIIREEEPENFTGYEDKTNYDIFNVKRDGYFFADEIKVDGETIFTIPLENQLENEQDVPKRKSRWGDRPQRRKKAQVNHIFNPLQGLTTGNGLLSITAEGYKHGQQYENKEEEDEEKLSRWGPEYEKTFHPPLLNYIPQSIIDDDLEYIIRLYRLDEIQNKMMNKTKTIIDDEDCRSPSPAPIYNDAGKRINTRDNREQESLQKEKYNLIEEALRINPTFIPPLDFKLQKKQKKIYLPEQNSEILKQKVIGQKGQTHKKLELESGCKISIKGKGSGNGIKRVENDVNDKLHILLQAETDEQLEKGAMLVDEILRGEEKNPESNANNQVSIITGYLNEDFCSKCHQTGHRHWECTTKTTFSKVELKCEHCGDKGHVSFDCKFKKESLARQQQMRERGNDIDVGQRFEQFINDVEGDKKLLNNYGGRNNQQRGISGTSFITDTIEIDPNMLMIKSDQKSYDNPRDQYSSGPSGSSSSYNNNNNNDYGNNNNSYNKYKDNRNSYRDNNNNNNDYNRGHNERNNDRNNRQSDTPSRIPPQTQPEQLISPAFMNQNTMGQFSNLPLSGSMPVPPNMSGFYAPPPPGGFPFYPPPVNYYGANPYSMPMFTPHFNNAPLQFNSAQGGTQNAQGTQQNQQQK